MTNLKTWRKTATTACHVAGFLREQAMPIPKPILLAAFKDQDQGQRIRIMESPKPSWWLRSAHPPLRVACLSESVPRRAHPEATEAPLWKFTVSNLDPQTFVLSPDRTACRSEGAEVVFRRRDQWRHCRYLPSELQQLQRASAPKAPPALSPSDLRFTLRIAAAATLHRYLVIPPVSYQYIAYLFVFLIWPILKIPIWYIYVLYDLLCTLCTAAIRLET